MAVHLDHTDIRLLAVLNEEAGIYTGEAANKLRPRSERDQNRRKNSQIVRHRLLALMRAGLVGYLDDQQPVCWVRTQAGTAALPSDLR